MHLHARRHKAAQVHSLFNSQHHVVTGATGIIAQVVVKADLGHQARLQQGNGLVRPVNTHPARRRGALIVQKHLHPWLHRLFFALVQNENPVNPPGNVSVLADEEVRVLRLEASTDSRQAAMAWA